MKIIKIKTNKMIQENINKLILSLAQCGIKVWVETQVIINNTFQITNNFICLEIKDKEED